MLQLSNSLVNLPVLSLRTGGVVASVKRLIINPNNLRIEGWYCEDKFSKHELILLAKDVREIVPQGIAIDDYDVLATRDDLVRLKEVLDINFELIGKPVVTDSKRKLGKVNDFATDVTSLIVMKLYITQPVYRNFSGGQLSIDRSQIVEISNHQIIVRDVEEKIGSVVPALGQA